MADQTRQVKPKVIYAMHQCPKCWHEWIEEDSIVCPKCEPSLSADLAVHDLIRATNEISHLPVEELKRHRDNLNQIVELLSDLMNHSF